MIVKTKAKITFYPDKFNAKKEFFYAEINVVEITEFKEILVVGDYYYKDAGEKVLIDKFRFPIKRNEATDYFAKFSSVKTEFLDVLEDSLYYILLEEMAKDLSKKTTILLEDLEITDNSLKIK